MHPAGFYVRHAGCRFVNSFNVALFFMRCYFVTTKKYVYNIFKDFFNVSVKWEYNPSKIVGGNVIQE